MYPCRVLMNYDLRKLAQMVAIADAGSFSKAAEQLHITQPALSRNIAALEKELGTRIFERGRSGASLTEAGSQAVDSVRSLLRQADALAHNLSLYQKGNAGKVSFGMGPLVGSLVLPGLSAEFLQHRPGLRLRAVIKSSPELLQELLQDRLELFFCGREQLPASALLQVESIANLPIAYVVRVDHPLLGNGPVSLRQIQAYPLLAGRELPPDFTGGGELTCDNYHILRETTQCTDGVWITSPYMIPNELQSGQLRILDVIDSAHMSATEICLVRRPRFQLSPGAAQVLAFVKNFLTA